MAIDTKKIIKQADFCLELMQRLNAEIKADQSGNKYADCIWYHTRKQNDIIRLRRELNRLHKMLNPWGGQDDA